MMHTIKRYSFGFSIIKIIFLPSLMLSCALSSNGQENETAQLRKQWDQYSQSVLQEKLYVHLDRSFYSAGEIIWFKLYDLDAIQHKPIDISKVAMVELIAKDGKAVLQAKISMKDGFGNGSLLVPFSLNSGNYLFRAYTNWMKNFPADYYFEKQITVLNSQRKPSRDSASNKLAYDIQFFPEGGNLVFGFQSKMGFRNVDQFGRGVDCSGVVLDQKNDTVARFQSLKFGLGQFLFTPAKGETYVALIRMGDGQVIKKNLPTPYDNGYVMRLTAPDTGHLLVAVSSNVTMMAPAIFLFGQSNQSTRIIQQMDLKDGKAEFLLDKKILGEGISQLTIFNANRQPVCERLFFRKPASTLNIEISPGKEAYDLRQRVTLNLQTNDQQGQASAEMSVAVYLQDSLQATGNMDINSWLWLVSDLRGNIESPDYYLNNSGTDVNLATENLMLTQGWRRYRWEEILSKRQPHLENVPEYDGQIINGRIIDRRTGAAVQNTPVYLSIPGEKFRLNIATSNLKGELRFEVKRFYGPGELILQANGRSDSIYRIDIMNPYSEKFSSRLLTPFDINERYAGQLLFRSTHAQVDNHFMSEKKQQFIQYQAPDSFAFYGNPDKKYFLDDYTRFVTMEEVMREYVAEVRVRKNRDQFKFTVFDAPHNYFFENEPMVLLDGIPVFDINKIIAFDPLKMKKIEIVTRRYYLDSVINEGIVSYSTYKGDLGGFQLDPSSIILEWSGLQYEREFFSPMYETKDMADSRVPDFRNLLFWSAHLKTDTSGNLQIPFYTSDLPGKYTIVVEGISDRGQAGHGSNSFMVRKSR